MWHILQLIVLGHWKLYITTAHATRHLGILQKKHKCACPLFYITLHNNSQVPWGTVKSHNNSMCYEVPPCCFHVDVWGRKFHLLELLLHSQPLFLLSTRPRLLCFWNKSETLVWVHTHNNAAWNTIEFLRKKVKCILCSKHAELTFKNGTW